MMNMQIQLATQPGSEDRENEDFAGALPSCAVLLDGSGGPAELPSGCSHGTPWYVRQLGARCLAGMETAPGQSLAGILAGCIAEVSGLHRGTCDLSNPGIPATVAVMARATGDAFEYLVLGDSTIVIDAGGDLTVVTDRRIDGAAAAEKQAMEALPTGTPEHQTARIRYVTRQRELRNQPGGYPIASTDPQAAHEAYTGSVPLADLQRATLMSDGVTRFAEFGLGTWGDLLSMLDLWDPAAVFARIRAAEGSDPGGTRWPRAKRRDDVAVVHFTTFRRERHRLYRNLATALVRPAREALGMDHEEFAGHLDSVLGWQVTAGTVGRWETETAPPGDVVLACGDIVRKSAAITDAHLSAEARAALALLSPSLADLERDDPG
jgi:hypothetical protein